MLKQQDKRYINSSLRRPTTQTLHGSRSQDSHLRQSLGSTSSSDSSKTYSLQPSTTLQIARKNVATFPITIKRRSGTSYDEMHRLLFRLERDKAITERAIRQRTTLEDILDPNYTIKLPSAVLAHNSNLQEFSDPATLPNELDKHDDLQTASPPEQLPSKVPSRDGFYSQRNNNDIHANTQKNDSLPIETQADAGEVSALNAFQDDDYGTSIQDDHCSPEIQDSANDGDVDGVELNNNLSGSSQAKEAAQSAQQGVEEVQDSLEDANFNASANNLLPMRPHEAAKESNKFGSASPSEDTTLDNRDKGNGILEGSLPRDHNECVSRGHHPDSDNVEALPGHNILRKSEGDQCTMGPSCASDLGNPDIPKAPKRIHLDAAAQLPSTECAARINEFLEQNALRIESFRTQKQTFSTVRCGEVTSIETEFSNAWDSRTELDELTDAVLWLDALLTPFQQAIFEEDGTILKPKLEQAAREWHAITATLTEGPLSDEKMDRLVQISETIKNNRNSNRRCKELLRETRLNVATITDFLSSAESIRYRRGLGRTFGERDDLVDTLRRMHRTVICAIPICPLGDNEVDEPARYEELQYPGGPFRPYTLPDPPEIFAYGPLSLNYYQAQRQGIMVATAAQKEDRWGKQQLKKNYGMNRDWSAFYDAIYGDRPMHRYEKAAYFRISSETREALRQEKKNDRALKEQEENRQEEEARKVQRSEAAQNEDQTDSRTSSTTALQVSPNPSDFTETTESSVDLASIKDVAIDTVVANTNDLNQLFCPNVNKGQGCLDWNKCPYGHKNAGKHCKNNPCKWGPKCAFIHAIFAGAGPSQATVSHAGAPATPHSDRRTVDLSDKLHLVLEDLERFNVCNYVNKPDRGGCTNPKCARNHSLKGIPCIDYKRDSYCPRGFKCPLLHEKPNWDYLQAHRHKGRLQFGSNQAHISANSPAETVPQSTLDSLNNGAKMLSQLQSLPSLDLLSPSLSPFQQGASGLHTDIGQQEYGTAYISPHSPIPKQTHNGWLQQRHDSLLPLNTPKGPRNQHRQLQSWYIPPSEPSRQSDQLSSYNHTTSTLTSQGWSVRGAAEQSHNITMGNQSRQNNNQAPFYKQQQQHDTSVNYSPHSFPSNLPLKRKRTEHAKTEEDKMTLNGPTAPFDSEPMIQDADQNEYKHGYAYENDAVAAHEDWYEDNHEGESGARYVVEEAAGSRRDPKRQWKVENRKTDNKRRRHG